MRRTLLLCGLLVAAIPIGYAAGKKETFTSIWSKYQAGKITKSVKAAGTGNPTVEFCDEKACPAITVTAIVARNGDCVLTIAPEILIVMDKKGVEMIWNLDAPHEGGFKFRAKDAIDFINGLPSDVDAAASSPDKQRQHKNKNKNKGAYRYDVHVERDAGNGCATDPIIVNSG